MEERNSIRIRLMEFNLSFRWLIAQLAMRGVDTEKTEMSSVIAGTRKGAKADLIIQTATDILDDYGHGFVRVSGG